MPARVLTLRKRAEGPLELSKRAVVSGGGEGLAEAIRAGGLAQGNLAQQPGERERNCSGHGRDGEHRSESGSERLDIRLVYGGWETVDQRRADRARHRSACGEPHGKLGLELVGEDRAEECDTD
jgi:hypothetical protein